MSPRVLNKTHLVELRVSNALKIVHKLVFLFSIDPNVERSKITMTDLIPLEVGPCLYNTVEHVGELTIRVVDALLLLYGCHKPSIFFWELKVDLEGVKSGAQFALYLGRIVIKLD